jgi:uncharacterized membrane protein
VIALVAIAIACALRPWRGLGAGGPPWPWLALAALMPLLWTLQRFAPGPIEIAMSGACALVLMAGWPLATLALPLVGAAVLFGGVGDADATLHRLVWLGIVPATLLLAIGALLRRWLPGHLFVYILGRGFIGTGIAVALSGIAAAALAGTPPGLGYGDVYVGRVLAAFGEAFLTGMLTAILVAYRPQWLATYSDRLYLPPPPPRGL